MPRNGRCVLPGLPYHVTQRGTNRQQVFFTAADRSTYLRLLKSNLEDSEVRVTTRIFFLAPKALRISSPGLPRRVLPWAPRQNSMPCQGIGAQHR